MRTLVVQAFHPWDSVHIDLKACMKTVERWAINRGYDYHCFKSPITTIDVLSQLNIIAEDFCNTQYYKFQWCDHPNYDRVCWIDADTVVWGDPDFLDDSWFCVGRRRVWEEGRVKEAGILLDRPDVIQPTLSLFWGCGEAMHNLHNWFCNTLENPNERGIILQTILEEYDFVGDERYLTEWIKLNEQRVRWLDIAEYLPDVNLAIDLNDLIQKQQFYYNWPHYYSTVDSLVHFPSANKSQNILRFLAYRMSLESPSFTVSNLLKKLQS